MADFDDARILAFLGEGTRTGKLGWTASDGRPLVAPVWFMVDDGAIVFMTGATTAKGRAIARDPRVVLCVDLEEPPYAFVQVQGTATTASYADDPDGMLRASIALGARYMGADRGEEFGRRNAVDGEMLVRVRPSKVLAELDMTG